MRIDTPFQGSLFANDFLQDAIVRLDDWEAVGNTTLADLDASSRHLVGLSLDEPAMGVPAPSRRSSPRSI